jgi:hypothetical protein
MQSEENVEQFLYRDSGVFQGVFEWMYCRTKQASGLCTLLLIFVPVGGSRAPIGLDCPIPARSNLIVLREASMTTYALDRLFQESLAAGLERNGLGSATDIAAALPPEVRRELSALLAEAIAAEAPGGGVEMEDADSPHATAEQLRAAILHFRSAGATKKITFLRIRDVGVEMLVPLVSMVILIWNLDIKAVVPALQSVTGLWKNLVTLRSETDSNAIDTYEALVALRATNRAAKVGPPDTAAIAERTSGRSLTDVIAALKRLADLKLIEIEHWGGAEGDFADPANAWKVRL